jgi:hypothetical protein
MAILTMIPGTSLTTNLQNNYTNPCPKSFYTTGDRKQLWGGKMLNVEEFLNVWVEMGNHSTSKEDGTISGPSRFRLH